MAIENEQKMKERLEVKNSELSKKLDASQNVVVEQKNKIEELESKVWMESPRRPTGLDTEAGSSLPWILLKATVFGSLVPPMAEPP